MSSIFGEQLPKTSDLLSKARKDVFADFAAGVYYNERSIFEYGGCGSDTLFDLASLTKVLCTTTLAAMAEERGAIRVSDPVKKYFPEFPDSRVLLSHLLNHSSGLPAWLALHTYFHDERGRGGFHPIFTPRQARERYEQDILASWVSDDFEKKVTYSDLGFMLLGWALEKALNSGLDALFQEWIAIPFKLSSLQFLPITPNVVPTEDCPWRGHVLRGEVHDDNCFVLGGVAGHAGLFGTVRDVIELAELWLYSLTEDTGFLKSETAHRYFSFSHVQNQPRTLGWDGITTGSSSAGQYFSAETKGHLGFTGTSLWIDPKNELIVSLLTNRVHPTRANEKIKQFRPLFHDTLLTEIGITS